MRNLCYILPIMLLSAILGPSRTLAQANPNLETGLKPYGSFQGGNIDTVSMNNGNLFVRIPIWSIPGRGGKLDLSFSLIYNNKGFVVRKYCPQTGCYFQWQVNGANGSEFGVATKEDHQVVGLGVGVHDSLGNIIGYSATAFTTDGSSHQMGQIGSTANWETLDGTGFEGFNFNANGPSFDSVIDRTGVRYASYTHPTLPCREDSNGNEVTSCSNFIGYPGFTEADSQTYTDTLQRVITPAVTTTDYSNCTGAQPITSAVNWTFPAPNGATATFKLCYAAISVHTAFPTPQIRQFVGSIGVLQSVVLPNLTTWTFTYDNGTFNYGDLTGITFPTGGTLSYTWTNMPICYSYYQNNGQTPYSRGVLSRTLDAHDNTGPHTRSYSWGAEIDTGSSRTRVDTVTDAVNNDTVYTETGLGYSCSYYETQRDSYQGTGSSRTLLQTIQTQYSYQANPWDTLGNPYPVVNTVLNVQPISVTTIWPTGQQKKTTTVYDNGFNYHDPTIGSTTTYPGSYHAETSVTDYDYGQTGLGGPLRQTAITYAWQAAANGNWQAYRNGNLIDLPMSIKVLDANQNQCSEMDFLYDSPSRLFSSNITTQHTSAPGTVRGNRSSAAKWLSGTPCQANAVGSLISSFTNTYDTGAVYQAIDFLGNTTTYTYDPTTYAGAYVTEIQLMEW